MRLNRLTLLAATVALTGCSGEAEKAPAPEVETVALKEKCRDLAIAVNKQVDEDRAAASAETAKKLKSGEGFQEYYDRRGKVEFVDPEDPAKIERERADLAQLQDCRAAGYIRDKQ